MNSLFNNTKNNQPLENEEYILPNSEMALPTFGMDIKIDLDETTESESESNAICDSSPAVTNENNNKINDKYFVYEDSSDTNTSETESETESKNLIENFTWNSLKWKCHCCGLVFNESSNLFKHYDQKKILNYRFYCYQNNCETNEFENYNSFINHMRFKHYESLKLCCDVCNTYFEDHHSMAKHRDVHNRQAEKNIPNAIICSECARSYMTTNELMNHLKSTHYYKCKLCRDLFLGETAYEKHMETHAEEEDRRPKIIKLPTEVQIKVGCVTNARKTICVLTSETKNGKFYCRTHGSTDNCTKMLNAKEQNTQHSNIIQKETNDNCSSLNSKQNFKPSTIPKPITVSLLNNTSISKQNKDSLHLMKTKQNAEVIRNDTSKSITPQSAAAVHADPKSLKGKSRNLRQCPKCLNTSENEKSFQVHLMKHVSSKPHSCKVCFKKFPIYYDLKIHMDEHSQQFPFTCKKCFQRFRLRATWLVHKDSHKKSFICEICLKGFQKISSLSDHMLCHL